jgi:hypothetical protein
MLFIQPRRKNFASFLLSQENKNAKHLQACNHQKGVIDS